MRPVVGRRLGILSASGLIVAGQVLMLLAMAALMLRQRTSLVEWGFHA